MTIFSVLIPHVADRPSPPVLADLLRQAEKWPEVEILWLGDNRRRSIGAKRQALLDVARGNYLAFVDDDDAVAPDYLARILPLLTRQLAVVTFDARVDYDNGCPSCEVICAAGNPNEEALPGKRIKRAVWHIHAWRSDIARKSRFPPIQWGEDWAWAEPLQQHIGHNAAHIEETLYFYRERGYDWANEHS